MQRVLLSSGDYVADRRSSYAQMLFESGDHAAAAELMGEAVSLVPQWIAGWFRLGEMALAAGLVADAADAWREVLRLDADDRLGAALQLALIGMVDGLDAPPPAYVETLFDNYAGTFETALVGKLEYCVPELIEDALREAGHERFAHVVDLGCGTGLLGERLRHAASFMEGIDISAGMLKRAAGKQIYDRLVHGDLNSASLAPDIDLVSAADVFMYVGSMDAIVRKVADTLSMGGLFAFSVELHDGPEPIVLRSSRRFAHAREPLIRLLKATGFEPLVQRIATIRTDGGAPIEGLVVVAAKRGDMALTPLVDEPIACGGGIALQ